MTSHGGLRAAIIGAGLMGRWHADAIGPTGGRVAAIVDPNDTARETLRQQYPNAESLSELDAAQLARIADVAHVCTPLDSHVAIATALIAHGLHALIEKPLAPTREETARLLEAADRRRVVICPVHQFPFQDGVQQVRRWLPSLGVVRGVEYSTCSAGAALDDAGALDRLVADILPHPLSLITAILGVTTAGVSWQVVHPTPGELRAIASIGPTILDLSISAHGRPTGNVVRVTADMGAATADLFHGFAVRHDGAVSRRAKITRPFVDAGSTLAGASVNLARRALAREHAYPGLRELVHRFYSAVATGSPSPIVSSEIADIAATRDELVSAMRVRDVRQVT